MKYTIVVLSSFLLLVSCGNSSPDKAKGSLVENPMSATNPEADVAAEAPIMTFKENIHNFGNLVDGEVVTYKFKFTNTGKSDLIISSASASCDWEQQLGLFNARTPHRSRGSARPTPASESAMFWLLDSGHSSVSTPKLGTRITDIDVHASKGRLYAAFRRINTSPFWAYL
jgi:hypothetical protein